MRVSAYRERLVYLPAAVAAVTAIALVTLVLGGSAADTPAARTAPAKSLSVAPTGSDSNPCTKSAPCRTLGYAYRLASDGDALLAAPGHYPAQEIDYSAAKSTSGPAVSLKPDGGTVFFDGGLQLGGDSNGCVPSAPNWLTIDGGAGKDFVISSLGACLTDHVTVSNARIGVGVATKGAIVEFHSPQNLLFQNNVVGPACCGFDGKVGSSPIELRLAISPGDPNSKNVTVIDNVFNGSARYCSDWNAYFSSYGPCPAPSCPDSTQCHNDAIHAYGGENLDISRNRFPVYDVQGVYLEEVNGANVSGTVDDNYFGHDLEGAWHAIWTSFGPSATGTWNIRFNTLTEANAIDVGGDQHGRFGTATVNVVGNLGGRLGNDTNQCGGSSLKVVYRYNMWEQASAPWIGHCDATDGGPYPVSTIASWLTSDGHLVGNAVPPVGFVAGPELCIAADIDGNSRPAAGCAAGVSEVAGSTPPPPPAAATFGNTTVGTSDDYASSNYKEASWFTAPRAGTISKMTGYISGLGQSSGTETIRAIVYADNNGAPGSLLGFSSPVTVKAGQGYGWVDFAFPAPVSVKAGKVWLGYQATGTTNLIQLKHFPQTNALAYNRDTYAPSGPSNPFGAASPADFSYSIYATYDASSPDTTPPTVPTGLTLSDGTKQSQVTVVWTASTDNVGVAGYHVSLDGVPSPDVGTTAAILTGLAWGSHTVGVSAFDAAGNVSNAATLTISSQWR